MTLRRVGIVGAGQLGRMLALAGHPLGIRCLFLDRSAESPGAQVAPILLGELDDAARLGELAACSDVITFDWENVAGSALAPLEKKVLLRPPRAALETSQDRLYEKALFTRLGIPVAPYAPIDSEADLSRAAASLGLPGILKTRRLGYDGKGQYVMQSMDDVATGWARLGAQSLIYERFQAFSREVSLIAARSSAGKIAYYPLSSNTHVDGILRYSVAPYPARRMEAAARGHLKKIMDALKYIGVLAVEFFVVEGRLIANEMAPRVHNSGHWTLDGCITSQFENHLRAICDLPLGSTRALGHTAMVNFLGNMPDRKRLLAIDGLAFHDYGKTPRSNRKLGHCTIVRAGSRERDTALAAVLKLIRSRQPAFHG